MALAGGALALGGCYDFGAPIDVAPRLALDPALLGTWRCLPSDPAPDATPANFVVARARDLVYSIALQEKDEDPDRYEAHASGVGGRTVLNVRDLDPKAQAKPWSFARYTFLLPDVLRVELVSDEALKGVEHSPGSLRAALERPEARPELYVDFCVCVRARRSQ
jgi:hypothetical protein